MAQSIPEPFRMTLPGPVLLFPGQGTEAIGMSSGWEEVPEWAEEVERTEHHTSLPLRAWMREGPEAVLKAQRHAPYAGIAHSVGLFRAHRAAGMAQPAVVVGHSLGFFSAVVAAGVVPIEAVLDLVAGTEDLADARFGAGTMGMAFAIGLPETALREALHPFPDLALSNLNGRAQFTVSGPLGSLEALVSDLSPRCLRAGLLPVRQPLHACHMAPLLPDLRRRLAAVRPRDPAVPIRSMSDGRVLETGAEAWEEAIASISLPVDWPRVVSALQAEPGPWLECGFGTQLSGLTRWLDRQRLVGSLQIPPIPAPCRPC